MNDLERELISMLDEDAKKAPLVTKTPSDVTALVRRRQLGTVLVAALAAIGLAVASFAGVRALNRASPPANPPPPTGVPATHNGEIVVITAGGFTAIDPDTGDQKDLVACPSSCTSIRHPVWSPDGTKLAYAIPQTRGGIASQFGVWILDPATGTTLQVTRFPTDCPVPSVPSSSHSGDVSWSRDGSMIAFGQCGGVYIMHPDGSAETRVTDFGSEPTLSPDGARMAFVASAHRRYGNTLYVVDTDGSNLMRLTSVGAHIADPAWSPDGSKIAYDLWLNTPQAEAMGHGVAHGRLDFFEPFQIWVIGAEGSHPTKIFDRQACCVSLGWGGPAWSPDGSKLASVLPGADGYSLFLMNPDGSRLRKVPGGLGVWFDGLAWRPVP
jgi:Tol biopolymer transport system component